MTTATDQHRTDGTGSAPALADRLDIADLVYRLAACLDEFRFNELGDLFTEDAAIASPGGTAQGRAAIVAQAARNHQGYQRLQHRMTNVLVELNGDHATARADLVARFVADGDAPTFSLGAAYRFSACRQSHGWRFGAMTITPVWRLEHG